MGVGGLKVNAEVLGSLLRGKRYVTVPLYQRHYSWEGEQVGELLDDVAAEIAHGNDEERTLFLGTIVFDVDADSPTKTAYLLDGQQRLFTLALLQLWWIRRLGEINSQSSGAVLQLLKALLFNEKVKDLGALDAEKVSSVLRLQPSLHDRTNFESLVRRGKGGQRGRSRLVAAFRAIHDRMESVLANGAKERGIAVNPDDEVYCDYVVEVAERLHDLMDQRIAFAVIEVEPPFSAFSIFEGLNSKGLELAQSDLVKNFLLSRLSTRPLQEKALSEWDAMVRAVPGDRVVEFLRAWYVAYHQHIQKADLYKVFKPLLSSRPGIASSLEAWSRAVWWFRALYEGRISDNHEAMAEAKKIEPELRRALSDWGRLGFKQGNPVLLALLHPDVCDPTTSTGQLRLARGIRLLETAYVRLFVTANVRGSVFESKLDQMCLIARTKKDGALDLLTAIVKSMCTDAKVAGELDWSNVSRNTAEARFLLYRIVEKQAGKGFELAGSDLWHVEHIRPQTKRGGFSSEEEELAYEESINKLGNLTLLLQGDNVALGNLGHREKVAVYALYDGKSRVDTDGAGNTVPRPFLPLNLDIAKEWGKNWDVKSIAERGSAMGKYASAVWPLDSNK